MQQTEARMAVLAASYDDPNVSNDEILEILFATVQHCQNVASEELRAFRFDAAFDHLTKAEELLDESATDRKVLSSDRGDVQAVVRALRQRSLGLIRQFETRRSSTIQNNGSNGKRGANLTQSAVNSLQSNRSPGSWALVPSRPQSGSRRGATPRYAQPTKSGMPATSAEGAKGWEFGLRNERNVEGAGVAGDEEEDAKEDEGGIDGDAIMRISPLDAAAEEKRAAALARAEREIEKARQQYEARVSPPGAKKGSPTRGRTPNASPVGDTAGVHDSLARAFKAQQQARTVMQHMQVRASRLTEMRTTRMKEEEERQAKLLLDSKVEVEAQRQAALDRRRQAEEQLESLKRTAELREQERRAKATARIPTRPRSSVASVERRSGNAENSEISATENPSAVNSKGKSLPKGKPMVDSRKVEQTEVPGSGREETAEQLSNDAEEVKIIPRGSRRKSSTSQQNQNLQRDSEPEPATMQKLKQYFPYGESPPIDHSVAAHEVTVGADRADETDDTHSLDPLLNPATISARVDGILAQIQSMHGDISLAPMSVEEAPATHTGVLSAFAGFLNTSTALSDDVEDPNATARSAQTITLPQAASELNLTLRSEPDATLDEESRLHVLHLTTSDEAVHRGEESKTSVSMENIEAQQPTTLLRATLAAVRIQRVYRGHCGRKESRRRKNGIQFLLEVTRPRQEAAPIILRALRYNAGRRIAKRLRERVHHVMEQRIALEQRHSTVEDGDAACSTSRRHLTLTFVEQFQDTAAELIGGSASPLSGSQSNAFLLLSQSRKSLHETKLRRRKSTKPVKAVFHNPFPKNSPKWKSMNTIQGRLAVTTIQRFWREMQSYLFELERESALNFLLYTTERATNFTGPELDLLQSADSIDFGSKKTSVHSSASSPELTGSARSGSPRHFNPRGRGIRKLASSPKAKGPHHGTAPEFPVLANITRFAENSPHEDEDEDAGNHSEASPIETYLPPLGKSSDNDFDAADVEGFTIHPAKRSNRLPDLPFQPLKHVKLSALEAIEKEKAEAAAQKRRMEEEERFREAEKLRMERQVATERAILFQRVCRGFRLRVHVAAKLMNRGTQGGGPLSSGVGIPHSSSSTSPALGSPGASPSTSSIYLPMSGSEEKGPIPLKVHLTVLEIIAQRNPHLLPERRQEFAKKRESAVTTCQALLRARQSAIVRRVLTENAAAHTIQRCWIGSRSTVLHFEETNLTQRSKVMKGLVPTL